MWQITATSRCTVTFANSTVVRSICPSCGGARALLKDVLRLAVLKRLTWCHFATVIRCDARVVKGND